ncbi:hypothetical protein BT67DRAFT_87253 [Trichocladium antarcticum]|uniref:Uncharacterized protein n=1 Tax=Trichocladium antarcticum TaxID=1450529 RepID=A0AAN6ZC40_9PEZI|nr:hypothetical protein BT67DRAFT_87253 [Trichocladium antarcticum]
MGGRQVARSLAILARTSQTSDSSGSLEVNLSQDSLEMHSGPWLPASCYSYQAESQPIYTPGTLSLPATPPADLGFMVETQLIDGVGCHFPPTLPSRASTLTVGSETGLDMLPTPPAGPEAPDTGEGGSGSVPEEGLLDTSRPVALFLETPIWSGPIRGGMFGSLDPLTPSPTPNRKRASSSPSAPQPVKRLKSRKKQTQEDSEDGKSPEKAFQEPASNRAFGNLRRLTISLAGPTNYPADGPGVGEESMLGCDEMPGNTAPRSDSKLLQRSQDAANYTDDHATQAKTSSTARTQRIGRQPATPRRQTMPLHSALALTGNLKNASRSSWPHTEPSISRRTTQAHKDPETPPVREEAGAFSNPSSETS